MTKDNLLDIFRTCRNNCKLVYASTVLFGHEDIAHFFTTWNEKLDLPKPYPDSEILPLLYDREVLKHAFAQLYDIVHITALTALFEMTKDYCGETGQGERRGQIFILYNKQPVVDLINSKFHDSMRFGHLIATWAREKGQVTHCSLRN